MSLAAISNENSQFSGGGSEGCGPFSHSSTLGPESEKGPKNGKKWHAEVAKFQLQKRVSQVTKL